jgi:hypothetical protein
MSVSTGETGPKLTCQLIEKSVRLKADMQVLTYFLKGPDFTQPPPLLGGIDIPQASGEGMHVLLRPATYAPSPERLKGPPSSAGDLVGSLAQYAHW